MKRVRRIHSWLGVLFAPSILLFVLSGMFQIAGCHEGEAGNDPPRWIVHMAQLHMKQTIDMPRRRSPPPAVARAAGAADGPAVVASAPTPTTMPLKLFFFAMAIGLFCSTLLGLYMAFTPKRDRRLLAGLLAVGTLLPVALMTL
jgi:hypothetical protein